MKKLTPFLSFSIFLVAVVIAIVGCDKKDNIVIPQKPVFTLSEIRFRSFKLKEAEPQSITITHPKIVDGKESEAGVITIIVEKGSAGLKLTPETINVNSDSFTVAPGLGRIIDFDDSPINFTITAKHNTSKQVHYSVSIAYAQPPAETDAKITGFHFTAANNKFLQSDIDAAKIIDGEGTLGRIYVFVPLGTDYNDLTPTVDFKGEKLFFSTNPGVPPSQSTTEYPAAGLKTAFRYPAKFYLTVKNGDRTRSYDVIVDVRNPFKFTRNDVTTGWLSVGYNGNLDVTDFVNQGNHPATVIAIIHTERVPAGISVLRANSTVQLGGLKPGESGDLMVNVVGEGRAAGIYKVKATLQPRYLGYEDADELLEWSSVNITTEIKE